MTVALTIRSGTTRQYPQEGEEGSWGTEACSWAQDATAAINASPLSSATAQYDAIVGTASQVSAGTATHTTLADAIAAISAGGSIFVLANTYSVAAIVNISKACTIVGESDSAIINSTAGIAAGAIVQISTNGVSLYNLKIDDGAGTPDYALRIDAGVTRINVAVKVDGTYAIAVVLNSSNCLSITGSDGIMAGPSGDILVQVKDNDATAMSLGSSVDSDMMVFDTTTGAKKLAFNVPLDGTFTIPDANVSSANVTQHEGDIDHNALTNTHNLTTDIDHNSITNNHNLTTDIDHDSLTNTHQGVDTGDTPTFANVQTGSNGEVRCMEGANYVGFEAPALTADQIWVLPAADGGVGEVMKTDGSGNLAWVAVQTLTNYLTVDKSANYTVLDNDNYRYIYVTAGSTSFTFTDTDVDTVNDHVTKAGHGLSNGDVVHLGTDGLLPAPLLPGKTYFVDGVSGNDFQLSLTLGGAAINLTTAGEVSGTQTVYKGVLITLPTVADNDYRAITVKKIDNGTGKVVVHAEGAETIDDVSWVEMITQYVAYTVVSDGDEWFVDSIRGRPRSYIRVDTGNTFGSTNTKIRRFVNTTESAGNAISVHHDAVYGTEFMINEHGMYSASYVDNSSAANFRIGISKNSSELTTAIQSLTSNADRLIWNAKTSGVWTECSVSFYAQPGDIIRPHADASATYTDGVTIVQFSITQLSLSC